MKKLISLLFIFGMLLSCDPKPEVETGKGQLDPNAKIVLRPDKSVQARSTIGGYTGLQVVQEAVNIYWRSHWFDNRYYDSEKIIARTFIETLKDYNKPALLMWGTDIISQEGDFTKDFIYGYDVVITDAHNDTIAFVPNSVINNARPLIEAAYNDENYTECYRLFNDAFTFFPYPAEE
jgi:hypothetical protein